MCSLRFVSIFFRLAFVLLGDSLIPSVGCIHALHLCSLSVWFVYHPDAHTHHNRTKQYTVDYLDCHAFNPGSFADSLNFVAYYPAQNKTEFSSLQDD